MQNVVVSYFILSDLSFKIGGWKRVGRKKKILRALLNLIMLFMPNTSDPKKNNFSPASAQANVECEKQFIKEIVFTTTR